VSWLVGGGGREGTASAAPAGALSPAARGWRV